MKFHPHNGTVLCKMLNEKEHLANEKGIVFNKEELPIYEIIEIGDIEEKYNFNIGDKIISNSIPTKINDDGNVFWLIKQEYIAGKIEHVRGKNNQY